MRTRTQTNVSQSVVVPNIAKAKGNTAKLADSVSV